MVRTQTQDMKISFPNPTRSTSSLSGFEIFIFGEWLNHQQVWVECMISLAVNQVRTLVLLMHNKLGITGIHYHQWRWSHPAIILILLSLVVVDESESVMILQKSWKIDLKWWHDNQLERYTSIDRRSKLVDKRPQIRTYWWA